uniref:C2HC/C3H-type domain-containing protein n=1 Tax=Chelonoidis abingdonii TaxID=106734 RepID=A0A8C0QSE6_CHEAB
MKHSQGPPAAASSEQDPAAELLHSQGPIGREQGELGECGFCGRKFLHLRLEKHMNVCSKSQGSKRKVFDSSMARARGTDTPTIKIIPTPMPLLGLLHCNNWRQKHESFIRTLRQAREMQHVISKGGKLSDLPPLPPVENPDYISCPHCKRRFAPKVAERHIPKCKTIKNRPPPPPQRRQQLGSGLEFYCCLATDAGTRKPPKINSPASSAKAVWGSLWEEGVRGSSQLLQ